MKRTHTTRSPSPFKGKNKQRKATKTQLLKRVGVHLSPLTEIHFEVIMRMQRATQYGQYV